MLNNEKSTNSPRAVLSNKVGCKLQKANQKKTGLTKR